jgi:hypothetical protein
MSSIGQKIKLSIDETRMLVLGTQVLISLQFDLAFQNAFSSASPLAQDLVAVGLAFLLAAFALLLLGPAYHRIGLQSHVCRKAQMFMIKMMCAALFPLSAALGIDAFVAFDLICGRAAAIAAGSIVFCFCLIAWYGFGLLARSSRPPEVIRAMNDSSPDDEGAGKLHDRVNQVMTEARIVLPGAQAMLGFQFITFFEKSFEELPTCVKATHLICTSLIALTVIMLITPAAFHRMADGGEESERLVHVAGWCVVGAMIPLALGMAGDFFVVTLRITHAPAIAIPAGVAALAGFLGLWFGYTYLRRK